MKQILLIIAGVALAGCGKKDDGNTGVVNPNKPSTDSASEKLITDHIVEKAIRVELKKPTGKLTKSDLDKVTYLYLGRNKLTELPKGLEKLTQLEALKLHWEKLTELAVQLHILNKLPFPENNPDLTKAQIDELKKALPECDISSNPTK